MWRRDREEAPDRLSDCIKQECESLEPVVAAPRATELQSLRGTIGKPRCNGACLRPCRSAQIVARVAHCALIGPDENAQAVALSATAKSVTISKARFAVELSRRDKMVVGLRKSFEHAVPITLAMSVVRAVPRGHSSAV